MNFHTRGSKPKFAPWLTLFLLAQPSYTITTQHLIQLHLVPQNHFVLGQNHDESRKESGFQIRWHAHCLGRLATLANPLGVLGEAKYTRPGVLCGHFSSFTHAPRHPPCAPRKAPVFGETHVYSRWPAGCQPKWPASNL